MKSTKRLNKSEWIRVQDVGLSARDVVTLAQKEGITLTAAQVYTARSSAKKKVEVKKKPGRPPGSKNKVKQITITGSAIKPVTTGSEAKDQFVALAMRIGTDEARLILDRMVGQSMV